MNHFELLKVKRAQRRADIKFMLEQMSGFHQLPEKFKNYLVDHFVHVHWFLPALKPDALYYMLGIKNDKKTHN